ncbi:MAG TPA: hypothetical protein VE422_08525 [Terriglobia bacterium]|nr:hypothetical protein [Terriglobia bacterium]
MSNRVMLLAISSMLILCLAGCGGGGETQQATQQPAAQAPPPKPAEPPVELYELTKDNITSHKDWTSRNITVLGVKIGDKTRELEKNFGSVENTRTTPEEYLTIYQGNGLFVYTFKITGKVRKFEIYDVFAKKIADENLKKLLTTGDLKLMRQQFGMEEGVVDNSEDNATEYSYDSRGFRFVKFKVSGKTINALRFSEFKKSTT